MTLPSRWALAALLLIGGMIGGAQFMEHVLKLDPCPLCLMQRLWTLFAGIIVLVALSHAPHNRICPSLVMLCSVIGGGFSLRQLWLQSLPPDQVPSCGPDMGYMLEVFPMSQILTAMTFGTGNCAEVTWSLLGISVAGWALAGFIMLAVVAGIWWRSDNPTT
jgi:disulfide bond formation protein DsbB